MVARYRLMVGVVLVELLLIAMITLAVAQALASVITSTCGR
jgi:hypothetical protein